MESYTEDQLQSYSRDTLIELVLCLQDDLEDALKELEYTEEDD